MGGDRFLGSRGFGSVPWFLMRSLPKSSSPDATLSIIRIWCDASHIAFLLGNSNVLSLKWNTWLLDALSPFQFPIPFCTCCPRLIIQVDIFVWWLRPGSFDFVLSNEEPMGTLPSDCIASFGLVQCSLMRFSPKVPALMPLGVQPLGA